MKCKYIWFLLLLVWGPLQAQDMLIIPQNRFLQITPVFQNWSFGENASFSQLAFPVYAYAAINSQASVNIRTSQANISGDGLTSLNGVTDTQIGVNYHHEKWNTVFSLNINVPSGLREFKEEEYYTSYLMSMNYFNLQVPNYGQGFNLAPGVNWAHKISDKFVLGLAAIFQYKGGFKPFEGWEKPYEPGNELSVTAGGDYNLSDTQILSADVIYTTYGSDYYDTTKVYASGDKIVANIMYQQFLDFNKLTFFFRYRSKAKNSVAAASGELVEESEKSIPDQFEMTGRFRQRISQQFYLGYQAHYRWFQSTPSMFGGASLFGGGLLPEYIVTPQFILNGQITFTTGSFEDNTSLTGIVAGLGMRFLFQ